MQQVSGPENDDKSNRNSDLIVTPQITGAHFPRFPRPFITVHEEILFSRVYDQQLWDVNLITAQKQNQKQNLTKPGLHTTILHAKLNPSNYVHNCNIAARQAEQDSSWLHAFKMILANKIPN